MIISYGPGGGYDLYGRLVAKFLAKHIPGNPIIVPQNMPGAGSFRAANFYGLAHDGTVIGSLSQTLATDTASGSVVGLNATRWNRFSVHTGSGSGRRRNGLR